MAAVNRWQYEARTRVTFFLPVNNEGEELAVYAIIRYLKSQSPRENPEATTTPRRQHQRTSRVAVTGFTHSQFPTTVFFGYWWDPDLEKKLAAAKDEQAGKDPWVREGVVFFIIDYESSENAQLGQVLRRLRQRIERAYIYYGSEQKEIWIIAQGVTRYVK